MNFDLSEDERLVQQTARDFADRVLKPRAAEFDKNGSVPREVLAQMAELGFMGMLVPEDYGGSGLNNFCLALVQMEVNRACASTGVTMSVHNSLFTSPLIRFGTEAQKKSLLPRLAKGELIGAYSLSEPGSGSDAGALRATATRQDGHWVLNGTKNFVTNGGIADIFIVFARTHADPSLKTKGISAILVERGAKGLSVGKHESKLGIRGSTTTELAFQDCRVPAANLLGNENEGFKVAMTTLDGGRIGIAAQAVGIAQACLDASIKYAKERRQFGKAIGEFQAIQWKLANMATDIEAGRFLVLRAARLRDEGKPHIVEASMAKLFAADMVNRHATEAVQIHGGVGYVKEFGVERFFRDAKITEIYEGTSEIQRMVIARNLLK
ncbi:MAG TPA: acyl-CoA dehydrogenase [Planctomycetota bacterium]|nr:acyl-CoA dehydrogenase [Planctomycetota bacterium]